MKFGDYFWMISNFRQWLGRWRIQRRVRSRPIPSAQRKTHDFPESQTWWIRGNPHRKNVLSFYESVSTVTSLSFYFVIIFWRTIWSPFFNVTIFRRPKWWISSWTICGRTASVESRMRISKWPTGRDFSGSLVETYFYRINDFTLLPICKVHKVVRHS